MDAGSACGCAQPEHCLVKILRPKRLLILRYVANNTYMSESAMLRYISESFGIPLSTLKLNMQMLLENGLVKRTGIGEPVRITGTGKATLSIAYTENEKVIV